MLKHWLFLNNVGGYMTHESNGFLWSDSVGGGGTLSLDGSGGPETGRGGASPPLGLEDWWIGRI